MEHILNFIFAGKFGCSSSPLPWMASPPLRRPPEPWRRHHGPAHRPCRRPCHGPLHRAWTWGVQDEQQEWDALAVSSYSWPTCWCKRGGCGCNNYLIGWRIWVAWIISTGYHTELCLGGSRERSWLKIVSSGGRCCSRLAQRHTVCSPRHEVNSTLTICPGRQGFIFSPKTVKSQNTF